MWLDIVKFDIHQHQKNEPNLRYKSNSVEC